MKRRPDQPALPHPTLLQGGMVYAVAVSAAAVLAPLLLAVLPVHAYRRAAWG